MKKLILIALFLALVSGCCGHTTRTVLAEGTINRVEYLQGNFGDYAKTIIHFDNGGTYVFKGNRSMPYAKHTKIRIVELRDHIDSSVVIEEVK